MSWYGFREYVPVAKRQANAKKQMNQLRGEGQVITPIEPFRGQKIARTFWGQAWCRHIECLSDFRSRLDRGKTYVRNGSVCHLAISTGRVDAYVCGSELYKLRVDVDPLPPRQWERIKQQCAAQVGSVVELLQGQLSQSVMAILTNADTGMFPHADDFRLDCNCPDFVRLCKHLAAVLYGVGVRLDAEPQLLFTLRGVDYLELIDAAGTGVEAVDTSADAPLADADLADVFGIDLAPASPAASSPGKAAGRPRRKSSKGATAKQAKKQPSTAKPASKAKRKAKALRKPAARKSAAPARKPRPSRARGSSAAK